MTVGALPITMAPAAGGKSVATEFGWAVPFSCATKTPRDTVPTSGFNLSTFVGKSNESLAWTGANAGVAINVDLYDGTLGEAEASMYFSGGNSNITTVLLGDSIDFDVHPDSWGVSAGSISGYSIRFVGSFTKIATRATVSGNIFGFAHSATTASIDTGYVSLATSQYIYCSAFTTTYSQANSGSAAYSGTIYIRNNTSLVEISKAIYIRAHENYPI